MKVLRWHWAYAYRATCPLFTIMLLSCSTEPALQYDVPHGRRPDGLLKYSLVFFIHGDGDYLYHDAFGKPRNADEVTVLKARSIAEGNLHTEVFIFHEKRKRHTFVFFPQRDGEFFYYRNGRLDVHERYWRDERNSSFGYETEMYRRFHTAEGKDVKKIVFFFGHEIPEFDGEDYNASYADRPFTVDTLAECLREFQGAHRPFDLVVLSTCYNGTPYTISAIAPYARYIVASPDNLHLSYFTIPSFGQSDSAASNETIEAWTKKFARDAFDTLAATVYTAVSVATYDASIVQTYVRTVDTIYNRSLSKVKEYPAASREHCDCSSIPEFIQPDMNRGVEVYYKPSRFGRSKHVPNHSGWECWKITGSP
ncbi:MAG: hypothetical protein NTX44_02990 [Ignavibacteriales bacterium]|nr:hypothetical protein [Ignavibacteriales bacterium]